MTFIIARVSGGPLWHKKAVEYLIKLLIPQTKVYFNIKNCLVSNSESFSK